MAAVLILGLTACFGLSEADERYNSGVELLDDGRFEEAVAEFDQAIHLDGSSAAAFHNRALAKEYSGNLPEAVEDYTRSIELDPDLALAYANRASVYSKLGEFQNALNDLDQALILDDTSVLAHNRHGLTLLNLGNPGRFGQFGPGHRVRSGVFRGLRQPGHRPWPAGRNPTSLF